MVLRIFLCTLSNIKFSVLEGDHTSEPKRSIGRQSELWSFMDVDGWRLPKWAPIAFRLKKALRPAVALPFVLLMVELWTVRRIPR